MPGARFAALYSPEDEATTLVAALVPMLMTLTGAFGTAALVASVTTPVMLPRSDCASSIVAPATHSSDVALIFMVPNLSYAGSPDGADMVLQRRDFRKAAI